MVWKWRHLGFTVSKDYWMVNYTAAVAAHVTRPVQDWVVALLSSVSLHFKTDMSLFSYGCCSHSGLGQYCALLCCRVFETLKEKFCFIWFLFYFAFLRSGGQLFCNKNGSRNYWFFGAAWGQRNKLYAKHWRITTIAVNVNLWFFSFNHAYR